MNQKTSLGKAPQSVSKAMTGYRCGRIQHRRTRPPEAPDFYRCWFYSWLEIRDELLPISGADDDDEMGLAHGTLRAGAMALIADDPARQTPDGLIALVIHERLEVR